MKLRLRLILSILSLATSLAVVGFVSVRQYRVIENQAESLLHSSIHEVDGAAAMMRAVQNVKDAVHQLLAAVEKARLAPEGAAAALTSARAAEARLLAGLEEADRYLERSRRATESGLALARAVNDERLATGEHTEMEQWLEPMSRMMQALGQQARGLLDLALEDFEQAERLHREILEPQLEEHLLPLIERYRLDSEEEVSQAARRMSNEAAAATRIVTFVSAVAVVLASILAIAIGHSVARPVEELRTAAIQVGKGELATRVEPRSRDELGELAAAFNHMVEELGRTTINKSYLDEVINTMTGALIIVDRTTRIKSVNQAALDLLGYGGPDLRGQLLDRICPEGDPTNTGSLVRLSDTGRVRNLDRNFVRKDGTVVPVSFSGSTLRDPKGRIREFVCVAYDISERKRMEQRLRSSLQEKELLLREVHHRVKNNLQVISSLFHLQSEYLRDPRHLEFVNDSRNRIRSMALIHEQLYRTDDLAEIHLQAYVDELIAHLVRSFGIEPGRIVLRLRVEELPLDLDRAIACGLILNELVSNSLKHAFPSGSGGEVRVAFFGPDEDRVRLVVGDDGTGLDAERDLRDTRSMGLTLVAAMVKQLRGTLNVHSEGGTEFRIDFPRRRVPPEVSRAPEEDP